MREAWLDLALVWRWSGGMVWTWSGLDRMLAGPPELVVLLWSGNVGLVRVDASGATKQAGPPHHTPAAPRQPCEVL